MIGTAWLKSIYSRITGGRGIEEILWPGFETPYGLAQPENFESMVRADVSLIYICSNINATNVARVPLRLYVNKPNSIKKLNFEGAVVSKQRRKELARHKSTSKFVNNESGGEIIEIFEHPFLDLMDNVNPWMNGNELMYITQKYEELLGNAYWFVLNNNLGIPAELWALPAQNITIIPDKDNFIKGYMYKTVIGDERLLPEEVIHHKIPSTTDVYYGKGPFAGVISAANINTMMHQYEEALFKNMARPSVYIDGGQINDAQMRKLKKQMQLTHGGPTKAGGIMVGSGKPTILSYSPKDMNVLLEGMPIKKEIANAFDIPISMLETEAVPLANAKTGRLQYAETGLEPRLKRKEQKINEQLLPRWDERLFCAFDNVIPDDEEFLLQQDVGYVNGGIWTINEVRLAQGKEPMEGGDELKKPQELPAMGNMELSPEKAAAISQEIKAATDMVMRELDKQGIL